MKKGYLILIAGQCVLAAGIIAAQSQPPQILSDAIDRIALVTILTYVPLAVKGGMMVAEEKGYHFLVGFFLGLFSIPGLLVLMLIPEYRSPPIDPDEP